jgi:hypothetical protein
MWFGSPSTVCENRATGAWISFLLNVRCFMFCWDDGAGLFYGQKCKVHIYFHIFVAVFCGCLGGAGEAGTVETVVSIPVFFRG